MSLADIVDVTITATTTLPSAAGFGTPLIAAYHTRWVDRVRTYASLADLVDDGFVVTDAVYLAAAAMFSQNPRPKLIKVGRRALAPTQIVQLTVTDATQGRVYSGSVGGIPFTYTVPGAATTTSVATAIAALITAMAGVTAISAAAVITATVDTPGARLTFTGFNPELTVRETTTDPGIATDLAAILAADSDWYGLVIDSNGELEINATAAWVEANQKIFVATTSDTQVTDAVVTTDVGSDLQGAAYARTLLLFSEDPYAGAALLGNRLPATPGSDTWAFKRLSGITASSLRTTQINALRTKNVNFYTTVAGVAITRDGVTASGEFMDVTRFIDWLTARLQERVYGLLVNSAKLPYTDQSGDLIRAEVLAQLELGIAAGGIASDPAPIVTVPAVEDIATADRAARLFPDVTFTARLAGAVHKLTMSGTLTV